MCKSPLQNTKYQCKMYLQNDSAGYFGLPYKSIKTFFVAV